MHRVRRWAREKAHGPPTRTVSNTRTSATSRVQQTTTAGAIPAVNSSTSNDGDPSVESHSNAENEKPASEKKGLTARFLDTSKTILLHSWINILLVFVPVGIAVNFTGTSAGIIFAMNAIAIIPLAGLLSHATESVAARMGDAIGALMNVTFGNSVELIIFIIALVKDEIRIVQASLLGSILANLLLILGMCFLLGGLRYREQIYNSTVTQMSACLLSLSVMSLLLPTAFHASFNNSDLADTKVLQVSRGTSVVLLLVYGLYLVFQLSSHSYMYESTPQHVIERESVPGPAAQYFNSSSSDSSSSSSSSDTDDSSHSRSTAKRIKRAIQGKRSRKQSNASQLTAPSSSILAENKENPASEAVASSSLSTGDPVSPGDHPRSGPALTDNFAAGDEADAEAETKPKKQKHKKRRYHRHQDTANNNPDGATASLAAGMEEMGTTTQTQSAHETRRVDFALAPDLEAQSTGTRPKPFSLRSIRPQLPKTVSQNVFRSPPTNPNSAFPNLRLEEARLTSRPPGPALRRSNSMPDAGQHTSSWASAPGAFPPINPIVVNSTPKTRSAEDEEVVEEPELSQLASIILLVVSIGLVALCAEFMVDAINEVVSGDSGVSEAFIGLILLPIVGNAAEHVTAVTVAIKNKMDLAIGVAIGSSIQIAIFVTPLVVILGWCMNKDMSLYFTLFETVSMFVSAFIVNFLVLDGRSNYLEGALLCSAYVIIAVAAFFYPDSDAANSLGGGQEGGSSEEVAKLMVRNITGLMGL